MLTGSPSRLNCGVAGCAAATGRLPARPRCMFQMRHPLRRIGVVVQIFLKPASLRFHACFDAVGNNACPGLLPRQARHPAIRGASHALPRCGGRLMPPHSGMRRAGGLDTAIFHGLTSNQRRHCATDGSPGSSIGAITPWHRLLWSGNGTFRLAKSIGFGANSCRPPTLCARMTFHDDLGQTPQTAVARKCFWNLTSSRDTGG